MNRVTDVFVDLAKELTISEGGTLVALHRCLLQSSGSDNDIKHVLENPLLCNRLRNHGNRICCTDVVSEQTGSHTVMAVPTPRPTDMYLPWIIDANRDYFAS